MLFYVEMYERNKMMKCLFIFIYQQMKKKNEEK